MSEARSSGESLASALRAMAEDDFESQLIPVREPSGSVRCAACGEVSRAEGLDVRAQRRLEGASDPDDMVLVVAAMCPSCGTGGTMTLAYGPEASEEDADVLAALPEPDERDDVGPT